MDLLVRKSLSVSAWVGGDDILGAEFAGTESNPS